MRVYEQNKNTITSQEGYTVLEILVALSLLFIVLIPVTQILSYLISSQKNIDKINALNFAEREMEKCLLYGNYQTAEFSERLGNRNYHIRKTIQKKESLVVITIKVYQNKQDKPIVMLYRYQFYVDS